MSSAVRAIIFDRDGINPVDVEPQITSVAWRLNATGQAQLFLPYSDAECTRDNLAPGNRVLLQFENGLPPFGGVIDVPRKQTANGVGFSVFTADRILNWRYTGLTREFNLVAAGAIFETLIEDTNAIRPTGIKVVDTYVGIDLRKEAYHYSNILGAIQNLQRLSGEDFSITPLFEGGQLTFEARWHQRKGRDLSATVLLREGENAKDLVKDDQGPIASRVFCPGGASGGKGWADRKIGSDQSATAENAYGYREYVEMITATTDQDTLDASATALLAEYDAPRPRFRLQALDTEPAGFELYDVGDSVQIEAFLLHSEWATSETVRLVGREWTPDNICRLEVK